MTHLLARGKESNIVLKAVMEEDRRKEKERKARNISLIICTLLFLCHELLMQIRAIVVSNLQQLNQKKSTQYAEV